MTPLDISKKDLGIIRGHLLAQAKQNEFLRCLEWGSGGSTIEFPKILMPLVSFTWTTIEHDRKWRDKVRDELHLEGLARYVYEVLEPAEKPFEEPMDAYVEWPMRFERQFHFIFVDGRKRRRCLLTAAKVLAPGGVVILHDSERVHYHSAFSAFSHGQFMGDKLWVGTNGVT